MTRRRGSLGLLGHRVGDGEESGLRGGVVGRRLGVSGGGGPPTLGAPPHLTAHAQQPHHAEQCHRIMGYGHGDNIAYQDFTVIVRFLHSVSCHFYTEKVYGNPWLSAE